MAYFAKVYGRMPKWLTPAPRDRYQSAPNPVASGPLGQFGAPLKHCKNGDHTTFAAWFREESASCLDHYYAPKDPGPDVDESVYGRHHKQTPTSHYCDLCRQLIPASDWIVTDKDGMQHGCKGLPA